MPQRDPYVDFEVLLSWVQRQRKECMDGENETHFSMMFAEVAYYLEGVKQHRDALERYGFKQDRIVKGWSAEPGTFVSVRPCGDEYGGKTYLGIYVGDVDIGIHNPCIWVPALKEYIFGVESWWGKIDSPEQLRKITDADIANVWYVRALRSLDQSNPPSEEPRA